MKKILFSVLLSVCSLSVFAQSKHNDPRIRKGLDASKIPVLKSIKDLNPAGLSIQHAVESRKAEFVWLGVNTAQQVQTGKSTTPNDLSLWRILRSENGTANWMWRLSQQKKSNLQSISNPNALDILQDLKSALRITDPKSEFTFMSENHDEFG